MTKLRHLVAEVDAALDIYLAGRTGQQFNKAAFILTDDCCELASKLFLITQNPAWDDDKRVDKTVGNPKWKNFKDVTAEVRAARPASAGVLARIEARRDRRNGFFHSAHLLDLTLQPRDVKDALSDLLDYGALLFGAEWEEEVKGQGNLETSSIIIRLDCKAHGDPSIGPKVANIFSKRKRTEVQKAKGCEVTHHPDDHHLRLAVRNGGKELRDILQALLD
jgi:hypothetical protein